MSSHILDAQEMLRRAQATYNVALRQINAKLRAAVAQDPLKIDQAREIQRLFVDGLVSERLAPHVQPPEPVAMVTEPAAIESALADSAPAVNFEDMPADDKPNGPEKA